MVYAICKEEYPKHPEKKIALVSPARIHVDEMDVCVCDIPIGRDDTGRSAVWVLYREWLYRRKIAKNPVEKSGKTRGKRRIRAEWVIPWSWGAETRSGWVKNDFKLGSELRL